MHTTWKLSTMKCCRRRTFMAFSSSTWGNLMHTTWQQSTMNCCSSAVGDVPSRHSAAPPEGICCASWPASCRSASSLQRCMPLGETPLLDLGCPSARSHFNTKRVSLVADLLPIPSITHGSEYIQTCRLSLNITRLVGSGFFKLCRWLGHVCTVLDKQGLQPTDAVLNLQNNIPETFRKWVLQLQQVIIILAFMSNNGQRK